jgi:hypothetical protein
MHAPLQHASDAGCCNKRKHDMEDAFMIRPHKVRVTETCTTHVLSIPTSPIRHTLSSDPILLSADEEETFVYSIVGSVACVLAQLYGTSDMALQDSIIRMVQMVDASEEATLCAFMQLSRYDSFCRSDCLWKVTSDNVAELFFYMLRFSTKMHDDKHFNNKWFSQVLGVPLSEFNKMEAHLLSLFDFNVFVPAERYHSILQELFQPNLHPFCSCVPS